MIRKNERAMAGWMAASLVGLGITLPCAAAVEVTGEEWMTPGPAVMSEEEKALEADPAAGIEHGVILLVEFEDKENDLRRMRVGMHMRAKILSNEARDLGNIEIPYDAERWHLKEWWARTIQPDGTVRELDRKDLQEVTEVRTRGKEVRHRKGVLPGIVPGSVIDYGYVLEQGNGGYFAPWWKLNLQWNWPVRELHYNWVPYEFLANGFVTTRAGGLDVKAERVINAVKVVARNLAPVKEEPWMPPKDSVRAAVWFFYFNRDENYKDFWNAEAKLLDKMVTDFSKDARSLATAVKELAVPPDADLPGKLKLAYDWTLQKVPIDDLSSLEVTAIEEEEPAKRRTLRQLLQGEKGTRFDRILLFVALARELGAEAHLVMAPDRTEGFWNRSVLAMAQFDEVLVAVRAPGQPLEESVLLAPHLGLPYGMIPYWVTASEAMVATSSGAEGLTPQSTRADENVSESRLDLTFPAEGEPARVAWSREGTGQHALEQQFTLKASTEEKRQQRLEEACGKGGTFEVERAGLGEASGGGPWRRLECEGTLPEILADPGLDELSLPLQGPWIEPYPDLTEPRRTHPMVFDYPCVDRAVLDVASPPGYRPRPPPEPVVIENPFGTYELKVSLTESGYRVERMLRRPHLSLPANRGPGVRNFYNLVRKADGLRLSFEPEEAP